MKKKEIDAFPKKGDTYYYVFSDMVNHRFTVKETPFFGGMTDALRRAKGNMFTIQSDAKEVCNQLNEGLISVKEEYGIELNDFDKKLKTDMLKRIS